MHTLACMQLSCLVLQPGCGTMTQAIQRQSVVCENKGIDMLRDGIILPGLAVLGSFGESTLPGVRRGRAPVYTQGVVELYREVCAHLPINLVSEDNRDLYSLVHSNLVGGPSIVFHRYHEAGLTRLRYAEHCDIGKLCHSALGVNANALHLYCMMLDMPMGGPVRTRWIEEGWCEQAGSGVRADASKVTHGWLVWVACNRRL